MNSKIRLGLAVIAGIAIGATAIERLHAQAKAPAAYAFIVIDEVTNPDAFKGIVAKAGPATTSAGGHYLARSDAITATEGAAPKRIIIIGFDSMDKLKGWSASPAQKEVDGIRLSATKSRQFFVEGLAN